MLAINSAIKCIVKHRVPFKLWCKPFTMLLLRYAFTVVVLTLTVWLWLPLIILGAIAHTLFKVSEFLTDFCGIVVMQTILTDPVERMCRKERKLYIPVQQFIEAKKNGK